MKVLRLRTGYGLPALKGEQSFEANEGTKLAMLPCGHFIITRHGKNVLVPGAAVSYSEVEPTIVQQSAEAASEAVIAERKKPGPKPKAESAQ